MQYPWVEVDLIRERGKNLYGNAKLRETRIV